MSKRTVVPIHEGPPAEFPGDRITIVVGSHRHLLNLRTLESRDLPPKQLLAFPVRNPPDGLAIGAAPSDLCPDRHQRQGEATNMKRFSITQENAVSVLREDEASAPESAVFHSEQELETVGGHWPVSRLVEIWNGLPGVAAVRKFKDRRTAVSRIWKRIQSLEPAEIPQPAAAAEPEEAAASAEPATAAISRKDQILALLRAPDAASRDRGQRCTAANARSTIADHRLVFTCFSVCA